MSKTNEKRIALIRECLSDHYQSMVMPHGKGEEWDWKTHKWIRQGHGAMTMVDLLKEKNAMPSIEECKEVVYKLIQKMRGRVNKSEEDTL